MQRVLFWERRYKEEPETSEISKKRTAALLDEFRTCEEKVKFCELVLRTDEVKSFRTRQPIRIPLTLPNTNKIIIILFVALFLILNN